MRTSHGARLAHQDDIVQVQRHITKTGILIALSGAIPVAYAGLDAQGQREVDALLAFVGNSHCTFIRNGKSYDAADAQSHLAFKLNYLVQRDKVNSPEEFIERAGTGSSLSGKPYLVNCDGNERPSADWLKEELRHLREAQP